MKERTYGTLRLDRERGRWVASDVETHVVIRLKKLFPRIPLDKSDDFAFANDPFNCTELDWFMNRYPFRMSKAEREMVATGRKAYERAQLDLERILAPDWKQPAYAGLREGQKVRHYQAQAVEIAKRTGRLLLGDDVGLGKTYTGAALLLEPGMLPAAVVVESHLTKQWKEKLEEFTTLRVHVIKKREPYQLPPADVYVFAYTKVLGWGAFFRRDNGFFKAVVYDEIQNLRTGRASAKGEACTLLSRYATTVMAMSATPIHGMGIEIYEVLSFLDPDNHPLGAEADFRREWCNTPKGQVKDPKALGSHLRERHLFLRRSKGDVGQEMGRVNTVVEEIPYDVEAERKVEELTRALAIRTVSAPAFNERGMAARELDLLMRHTTGVAKAASVAAYVRMLLEGSDRSVLLIGWHRDVYTVWLRELREFKPVMYTGSESLAQKRQAKDDFVARRSRLMIMSLGSGAGLDGIQKVCSTVVFGELAWSGEVHKQIIGRADREGQVESTVDAIFLHADGGSDPPMIELLGVKASQAKGIVDPEFGVSVVRSESGRIQALAREFLRRRGIKAEILATPDDPVAPADAPTPEDLTDEGMPPDAGGDAAVTASAPAPGRAFPVPPGDEPAPMSASGVAVPPRDPGPVQRDLFAA